MSRLATDSTTSAALTRKSTYSSLLRRRVLVLLTALACGPAPQTMLKDAQLGNLLPIPSVPHHNRLVCGLLVHNVSAWAPRVNA